MKCIGNPVFGCFITYKLVSADNSSLKYTKFCGKDVIVVKSGIGKVNAAICTQILATYFKVDAVINTGIAGSLRAEINIGDVVLSTDALQHDMDATNFGYEPDME